MVPTQNRLHLPLIKRAWVSRVFDHIPLPSKKFHLLSTWYSTDEDPPVKIMLFMKFQIDQITVCQINNHLK
jgi:hypothetical protein